MRYSLAGTETRGTLFEWRAGRRRCAAGFVDSLQSRVFANSGELEFWCRRTNDLPIGRFRALPKPNPAAPQSRVANVDGRLLELNAQRVYDFRTRTWQVPQWPAGLQSAYTIQRVAGQRVITGTSSLCPGLTVWVNGAYRGTVETPPDGRYSAVTVAGNTIWVNIDGDTRRGTLLPAPQPCSPIQLTTVVSSGDWIYGYEPMGDGVLFGGVLHPDQGECAPVYTATGTIVDRLLARIAGQPCSSERITEWYSFTQDRHGILIGNYPEASLMRYLPSGGIEETRIAAPTRSDWVDPATGAHYRESQSVVSTMGMLLVGLYPWSEVLAVDQQGKLQHRQRLLTTPSKQAATKLPYFDEALRFAQNHPTEDSSREGALYPSSWGQRVPTIAILNGRVCASTGNLGGVVYDPNLHSYLPASVAYRYGTVFCARTTNQTLASGPLPRQGRLRFSVSRRQLRIYLNGKPIAHRRDSLRPADLRALARGRIALGRGPYGDLSGLVSANP